ncbi:hypothetical protein AKO1_002404, partial [Acrasis kona]
MNPQQNTLNTIRNILSANSGGNGHDPIYNNAGSVYGNGVISPPQMNPVQGTIGRPESPLNEEELGMQIQRATSAPPVLDNILFASQSRYSHLFGDIRCDQNYENFYRSHNNPSKLPQPLDNDVFLMSWLQGPDEGSHPRNSSAVQPPHHHQSLSMQHLGEPNLLQKLNGYSSISPPQLSDHASNWGFPTNADQHFGQSQFIQHPQQQQQQQQSQPQQQQYQNLIIRPQPVTQQPKPTAQPAVNSSSFYSSPNAPPTQPNAQPSYSSVLQQVIKSQTTPPPPSQPSQQQQQPVIQPTAIAATAAVTNPQQRQPVSRTASASPPANRHSPEEESESDQDDDEDQAHNENTSSS